MPANPSRPLEGRVALVTGASGDIGGATAVRLAELGARVGVNYHATETGARKVLDLIERAGGSGLLLQGDVGKESDVSEMVRRLESELGGPTLLVNNSGHGADHNQIENISLAEWDRVIATNLTGAFLCTRAVIPAMKRAGFGRIVNVSSICGLSGDCDPAYCAGKAGILGLTRSSAARLAPTIQVNAVLPGFVGMKYHAQRQELVKNVAPDGRISDASEIAELICSLLSLKSSFLTGACIPMDGGASMSSLGMHMGWVQERD